MHLEVLQVKAAPTQRERPHGLIPVCIECRLYICKVQSKEGQAHESALGAQMPHL